MARNVAKIAALNDLCRTAMGVGGRVFMTSGIAALSPADQSAIREKVETFDAFDVDNDPVPRARFRRLRTQRTKGVLEDRLLRQRDGVW